MISPPVLLNVHNVKTLNVLNVSKRNERNNDAEKVVYRWKMGRYSAGIWRMTQAMAVA